MNRFYYCSSYTVVATILFLFSLSSNLWAGEQGQSRRERRELSRQFEQAQLQYEDQNYWEAHLMLRDLSLSYTSQSDQKDSVDLYIIRTLAQMEMREYLSEMSSRVIDEGTSKIIPEIRLLHLIHNYKDGNFYGVEMEYREIIKMGDEAITEEARYYYGQSLYWNRKRDSARVVLQQIPVSSTLYSFAQHTIGVIFASENQFDSSFYYHSIAATDTSSQPNESEIINLSRLYLGVIFYQGLIADGRNFIEAETHLQEIPASSSSYENALLLRIWCAYHRGNWEYMKLLCDEMKRITSDPLFIAEVNLLLSNTAQGLSQIDGTFYKITSLIEEGIELVEQYSPITQNQLTFGENIYFDTRGGLYDLTERVVEIALSGEQESYSSELDSLKIEFVKSLPIVKNVTFDSFEIRRNPFHNQAQLLDDLRYVQARYGLYRRGKRYHWLIDNVNRELEQLYLQLQQLEK